MHIIGKILEESQIFITIHKLNALIEILILISLIMKMVVLMVLNVNFLMVIKKFKIILIYKIGWKESEYHPLIYKTKPC